MSEWLVLVGAALAAVSGLPGLFLGRQATAGQLLSVLLMAAAAGLGLTGVGAFWLSPAGREIVFSWPVVARRHLDLFTELLEDSGPPSG